MLTDFQRKYPSELISPEILPSLSFLNLLHEAVESKQISWISWRLRTSQSDEQAMTEKRRPRTDSALLQSLLSTQQDELVVDVPRHLPLESVLRRYLDRLSVALSLLDACHLLTLKKMSEKFISLATAVPLDRSLRGPTLAEAMDADRTLWTSIGSLQREYKWSLHDCLSEVTHVRSDMHNALAPRPRAGPPPNEQKQKRQRVAPPPALHATPRPPKTLKKPPAKKSTASDSGRNKETPDLDERFSSGGSVSAGAYFRHKTGLRKACSSHPMSVRVINSFITFMSPNFVHSSFVLIDGIASEAHCDVLSSLLPNIVIPVTSFQGGDLRVECPLGSDSIMRDGIEVPAARLPVSRGPAAFSASQCLHEVLPFQGRRLVVAAYTLKACARLSAEHSATLRQLGFRLPSPEALWHASVFTPRMLCLSEAQAACLPSVVEASSLAPPVCSASVEGALGSSSCEQDSVLAVQDVPQHLFHGRFFLDLCSGAEAPVTKAMRALGADCFEPLDIIHGAHCDLLSDDCFDRLLGLSASGLIGAALAAPPCGDFSSSMLKMRPGGPAPLRWLKATTPFVIQVAACEHELDVAKHWMFSSNRPGILELVPSQDRQAFLAIEPGQPFRLNVLEKLLRVCDDSEAELCSSLREGVRLGVDFDIPPSEHWPLRSDEPELADLVICEGAWRSASDNPTQVRELIASELQEGWIEEYSSLSEIQSKFTSVAVGKLGLVVKFKTLESLVGRLLWVTGLWKVLRPLLSPLYRALRALPSSCVGVSPELWNCILRNVDPTCVLTKKAGHPSFHAGARITRVANSYVTSKDELLAMPFRKRRLWVEVRDPDHPLRIADQDAVASLHAWKALLVSTPFVKSLRSPVDLQIVAEADACATESSMGLGGYVCWPNGRSHWFAVSLSASELQDLSDIFQVPLQSQIAALELLAQLLLLWCVHQALPSCRGRLRVCLRCDNSAAEAAASKGMSPVLAMSAVLQKFLAFQAWTGIDAEVEHIAGYKNALADELSRMPKEAVPPLPQEDRVSPPLRWLLFSGVCLMPPEARWPTHV
ncbi:unnamed protein product, partial [Symbiodinium microadriaticum]